MKDFLSEQWASIPGYEGIYEASDAGRIRSCEGKITLSDRHGIRRWKQRILKQKFHPGKNGRIDARICLYKDKKPKTFLVSRLVAMAWCSGYSPDLTVNHKDGNPLNNAADNLEWVTRAQNIQEAFSAGLYAGIEKEICLVRLADNTRLAFPSWSEASAHLGHTRGYISNCFARGRALRDTSGSYYRIER